MTTAVRPRLAPSAAKNAPKFGPGFSSVTTDANDPIGLLIPNDYAILAAVYTVGPCTAQDVASDASLIIAVVQLHLVELCDRGLILRRHIGGANPRSVFLLTNLGERALRERPIKGSADAGEEISAA
jgi:DNA-binding MarR family transcriptional regulator